MIHDDLKLVWVGFHEEGEIALSALLKEGYKFSAIITLSDEEANKRSGFFDFKKIAKKYSIPLFKVDNINDAKSIEILRNIKPDILCVIGWSQILNSEVLNCASILTIGAHASLLPNNRGSAPINWCIILGEVETGNTLIELNEGVDTGGILAQRKFNISLFDSCKTLYQKVAKTNAEMLLEVLSLIRDGNLIVKPQGNEKQSVLPRRRPGDGKVNWSEHSKTIYDFVRALTHPYPGAFTYLLGLKVFIWKVSWSPNILATGKAGSLSGLKYSYINLLCGIEVNCSVGVLTIHELEVEGEGLLSGEALLLRFKDIENFDE